MSSQFEMSASQNGRRDSSWSVTLTALLTSRSIFPVRRDSLEQRFDRNVVTVVECDRDPSPPSSTIVLAVAPKVLGAGWVVIIIRGASSDAHGRAGPPGAPSQIPC